MHPVDLLAPVSPISWDNIALRGVQAPTRAGRDGKRLNSTVYGYTFLLATLTRSTNACYAGAIPSCQPINIIPD